MTLVRQCVRVSGKSASRVVSGRGSVEHAIHPDWISWRDRPAMGAATLVALGVDLVVVGGCALVVHDVLESCGDLDIVPGLTASNLRRLSDALDASGGRGSSERVMTERPVTSVESVFGRIDVMTATAAREYGPLAQHSETYWLWGVPVAIAAVPDVLRLRARFRVDTDRG
jgi:hypothetical protein